MKRTGKDKIDSPRVPQISVIRRSQEQFAATFQGRPPFGAAHRRNEGAQHAPPATSLPTLTSPKKSAQKSGFLAVGGLELPAQVSFDSCPFVEPMIQAAASCVQRLPDALPGKTRLGRYLLRLLAGRSPATLRDRLGCIYELPSYAEAIALELFTFGAYQRDTQKLILDHLSDSGTFIDVGANIGSISIPIARMRPDARIVSIEADPTVFDTLTRNIDINHATNIAAVRELIGANSNAIDFYRAPATHFGMGSIGPQFGVRPVSLQQSTLDDVLAGRSIKQVDVLKIDVEGAELSVLQGAHHLLSLPRPPVVIFEFQDWAETRGASQSAGDAQRFLLSKQFKLYNTADRSELTTAICAGGTMILAIKNC